MPMYYPDLDSVSHTCEIMAKNLKEKKYTGIIPKNEDELPEARRQLAQYFRDIWHDEIAAIEVEMAVTEDNYHEKMGEGILLSILKSPV